jgi:hypothetical protein
VRILCRLTELVRGVDIDVPGGTIRVVDVQLRGDASKSLRRGRQLVFFEFAIDAKWEGELIDSVSGNVLGTGACAARAGMPSVLQLQLARVSLRCAAAMSFTGAGDGELTVPDIDQDSGEGYEVRVTAAEDGGERDQELAVSGTGNATRCAVRGTAGHAGTAWPGATHC